MNKIIADTQAAHILYVNKKLSESEVQELIESGTIDLNYLQMLQENTLKKIATHPVTKALGAVGALAGAAYLGHNHGFESGHTQGFESGHTQGVVDTSNAYNKVIDQMHNDHTNQMATQAVRHTNELKNIAKISHASGFEDGKIDAYNHPGKTLVGIGNEQAARAVKEVKGIGDKVLDIGKAVVEKLKLPPTSPGGSHMFGTR